MDLPSPTLKVPLKDLLYKPTKILRRYNFTGFFLVYNTVSGSYHLGTAKNIGIKLVSEFNLLKIGKHDLIDLQQDFDDSYQSIKVLVLNMSSNPSFLRDKAQITHTESLLKAKLHLKQQYSQ